MMCLPAGLGAIKPGSVSGASYDSVVLGLSSLWSYLKLAENPPSSGGVAADVSGNGRNGTYSADTFTTASGIFASSPRSPNFTAATTQYVQFPNYATGGTALSVGLFFKTTSASIQQLFSADNGSQRAWQYRLGGSTLEFIIFPSTTTISASGTFNDGNGHLAVAVFDPTLPAGSGIVKLYIDGSLVAQSSTSLTMNSVTSMPYIGRRGAGSDNYFTGNLSNAFICASAISGADVAALWAARNNP